MFFVGTLQLLEGKILGEIAVSWIGYIILVIFVAAYVLVFAEEKLHIRKSMPVMVAAGLIWSLAAVCYHLQGHGQEISDRLRHVVLEYAELFLFLLSAMSFVNTMVERNVFEALRSRLAAAHLSLRGVFWITGLCAFCISPIADNLTTSLVMGTVVLSTMGNNKKVITAALVNVVVAANAGGVFSPFGDISTLMIWQKGVVGFGQFFSLFIPSLVNWLVPAVILSTVIPKIQAESSDKMVKVRKGGRGVVCLFLLTIFATILLDHFLHLPPFLGMMMGFGILNIYGYFLHDAEAKMLENALLAASSEPDNKPVRPSRKPFDMFGILEKVEWDTLLFFYGILLSVGGIAAIGYLEGLSHFLYSYIGSTYANISIGFISSIVDNIPVTFAVLTMNPHMDTGQWLLVTLTAGAGGSLLSIGSAAGVALMGIGKGNYTFLSHAKWIWAILLGYAASIATHLLVNHNLFTA
jgi:Na+/H+ antiporter NhaD/arsenite permease-like protein